MSKLVCGLWLLCCAYAAYFMLTGIGGLSNSASVSGNAYENTAAGVFLMRRADVLSGSYQASDCLLDGLKPYHRIAYVPQR